MRNRTKNCYFIDNDEDDRLRKLEHLTELTQMCTSPADLFTSDSGGYEERLLAQFKNPKAPRKSKIERRIV